MEIQEPVKAEFCGPFSISPADLFALIAKKRADRDRLQQTGSTSWEQVDLDVHELLDCWQSFKEIAVGIDSLVSGSQIPTLQYIVDAVNAGMEACRKTIEAVFRILNIANRNGRGRAGEWHLLLNAATVLLDNGYRFLRGVWGNLLALEVLKPLAGAELEL